MAFAFIGTRHPSEEQLEWARERLADEYFLHENTTLVTGACLGTDQFTAMHWLTKGPLTKVKLYIPWRSYEREYRA